MKRINDILLLIPHYNNTDGLIKSLASISDEEPIDVLIVDDGSKINIDEKELKNKFPYLNIAILKNAKNRGIEFVLNDGLKYAIENGYKYIARLDCGDICYPDRFKIQKRFLDKNPDIYLVGTWVEFVDMNSNVIFTFRPPITHEEIRKKMFINNMFIHPSVMFKSSAIKKVGFYPTNRKNAEDYAFFFKFVKNFKTANIDKVLLKYEVNPDGLSLSKRELQIKNRIKIIWDNKELSPWFLYGLIRNLFLLFVPYRIVEFIKRIIR